MASMFLEVTAQSYATCTSPKKYVCDFGCFGRKTFYSYRVDFLWVNLSILINLSMFWLNTDNISLQCSQINKKY